MNTKNQKKEGSRYQLLKPKQWGLDPSKTYVAVETVNGFAIRVSEKGWIGLPKELVFENPKIFKQLTGESEKGD